MPRRLRQLALAALLAGLAGCGPTPPQAPLPQAKLLDRALSGISTACGEADQVTAFPGDHRSALITLEVTAASKAHGLASVFALNPDWIYQGETVRQLVHDSLSMLDSCGLHAAATTLSRQTARQ